MFESVYPKSGWIFVNLMDGQNRQRPNLGLTSLLQSFSQSLTNFVPPSSPLNDFRNQNPKGTLIKKFSQNISYPGPHIWPYNNEHWPDLRGFSVWKLVHLARPHQYKKHPTHACNILLRAGAHRYFLLQCCPGFNHCFSDYLAFTI